MITSESFLRFKDFKAIVNASVPLAQPIENFELQNLEKFFSNWVTSFPSIKSPFLKIFLKLLRIERCNFLSCL